MKPLLRALSAASGIVKRSFSLSLSRVVATDSSREQAPVWGSRKLKAKKKLQIHNQAMCDPEIEAQLAPLRAAVKEQVNKAIRLVLEKEILHSVSLTLQKTTFIYITIILYWL